MTGLATRTIQKTKSLTLLQRIENKDKTAVQDCFDAYGNFIWTLARKFTASTEEAEAATLEIFQDIWRYSAQGDKPQSAENIVISQIARRLVQYLQQSQTISMAAGKGNNERTREDTNTGKVLRSRIGFGLIEFNPAVRHKIIEDKAMKFSNHRHRVLYAEDNEDSRDLVGMICEISGIEVVTAKTIAEAWQTAQNQHFDLYLLDSRFPDGDGLELCRRLLSFAPFAPILIYSGNPYQADKESGLSAGASDYLTKPYMADLAATIRQNIERAHD